MTFYVFLSCLTRFLKHWHVRYIQQMSEQTAHVIVKPICQIVITRRIN